MRRLVIRPGAIGDFIGEGYAIPYPAAVETIKLLAKTEGILLDPARVETTIAGHVGIGREPTGVVVDALARAEGEPVPDRKSPALYKKHAETMHQIVVRKYRANEFDALDRIVISPSDIDVSRWQSADVESAAA